MLNTSVSLARLGSGASQRARSPNSIEVIGAEELRARGVNDLRTALSLLGGVSVVPGSDDGPASAVPGLLGLREVDDFLLLVDGVPAGSVFIPQFATIDLNNVERIEVQRGSAPVLYGTTAFAGTINIVHYAAGAAEKRLNLAYGSFGSVEGSASTALAEGQYRASLGADEGQPANPLNWMFGSPPVGTTGRLAVSGSSRWHQRTKRRRIENYAAGA